MFFIVSKSINSHFTHNRYAIIDDSTIEQRTIQLVFKNLEIDEQIMSHFLCKTHFERTFNRQFAKDRCKKSKKHFYKTLYFRKIREDCENNINEIFVFVSDDKMHEYIKRKWWLTREKWINYVRQHSSLLFQCMITNAIKSWHHFFKTHAKDELFSHYLSDIR